MDLKICVVGPCKAGKTLLCKLLADQALSPTPGTYRPTSDCGVRIQQYMGKATTQSGPAKIKAELWDCAGDMSIRSSWATLSKGIEGCLLVHNTEDPESERQLEQFYKGFVQPHKLTIKQCLVLGVNMSGGYSMGQSLVGPMKSLPSESLTIDPNSPEASATALRQALETFLGCCYDKVKLLHKKQMEEEVLDGEE